MHNRLRLLKGATALMYFGTLLAGLIGQGWGMVPVFVVIFVLWSVILRPHLWPVSLRDMAQAEALIALAALIATQVLLVTVCFAVGRGLGGVLGVEPALPFWLPATLAFLAVPLSRLIWNPRVMAENAGFDPLSQTVTAVEPVAGDPTVQMLAEVMALPAAVSAEELQPLMTAIVTRGDPALVRHVLVAAVTAGRISQAGRKAVILHATDPEVTGQMVGSTYLAQAFAAAGQDAELLDLFARRCLVVLADAPGLAADCPNPEALRQAAKGMGISETAQWLQRLAGLLDQRALT